MIIKTKKYQLDTSFYIKTALMEVMREFWWAWFVPVVILIAGAIFPVAFWWCFSGAILISILYVLFWWIQFAGATQLEQNKMMFDKYSYEIDSRQILMKKNSREGMTIQWNMIKSVKKTKEGYLLFLSRGQFFYFPFSLFKSDIETRFLESVLKRKELLKDPNTSASQTEKA